MKHAAASGIDIFRIFDSLNYTPNLRVAMEAVQDTHAICEAAVCYTGDILDPKRTKYSLKYYVKLAKELERMGAHFLAIKDMAGVCRPYAAYQLVKALKEEIGLPIHFHTHDTSGINSGSILRAAVAGIGSGQDGGAYDAPEPNLFVGLQDHGHSHWANSLMYGADVEDVMISGSGLIDGSYIDVGGHGRWESIFLHSHTNLSNTLICPDPSVVRLSVSGMRLTSNHGCGPGPPTCLH